MNIKKHITKVPQNIIKELDEIVFAQHYRNSAAIIYKGHIPNSGFLLLDGQISLSISKTKNVVLNIGSLIGIRELMNSIPIEFDVNISSDSSVLILDRSSVNDIFNGGNKKLKEIFLNEIK
jgi:signal-transduction protein with cAMP-binding, CBS, and nucleotidyltransferase domain